MPDAEYCPVCGEPNREDNQKFISDRLHNVYRTEFWCSDCGYEGEVIRHEVGDE